MSLWWSADQHFGHKNIIQYCNRPFATVAEMDAAMVDRWNGVVGPDDTTVCVGDFSFWDEPHTSHIMAALHGKKILVRGNHDKHRSDTWWRRVGFASVMGEMTLAVHEFEKVFVAHVPMAYGMGTESVQIHGHVHDRYLVKQWKTIGQLLINVGVDQWDFTPVSNTALLDLMREATRRGVDGFATRLSWNELTVGRNAGLASCPKE